MTSLYVRLSANHPDAFLLYSSSRIGMIRGIDLNGTDDVIPPIDGLDGPVTLAYDAREQMIYYSMVFHGKIGRRKLDGSQRNDSFMDKGAPLIGLTNGIK